jgi:glucose-6-phosphate 1-dehydrogenase
MRDMAPNHLFQLLAMVGMEPPNSFAADAIRAENTGCSTPLRFIGLAKRATRMFRTASFPR